MIRELQEKEQQNPSSITDEFNQYIDAIKGQHVEIMAETTKQQTINPFDN